MSAAALLPTSISRVPAGATSTTDYRLDAWTRRGRDRDHRLGTKTLSHWGPPCPRPTRGAGKLHGQRSRRQHASQRKRARRARLFALVLLAAVGLGVGLWATGGRPTALTPRVATICQNLVVPAYFTVESEWGPAEASTPEPSTMILGVTSTGSGGAPNGSLQAFVTRPRAKGITILGYVATNYEQRPIAAVETDIKDYKAWYGVTDIFLDQVTQTLAQIDYYETLSGYVHQTNPGSRVWLNPGVYPNQLYMALGDVVMVYQGTFANYVGLRPPAWTNEYAASRFAHVIYDTPSSELLRALQLAQTRNAGYVYVTDGAGSNPYGTLPSYWSLEGSALRCS